jgi:Response regulator receiver domain
MIVVFAAAVRCHVRPPGAAGASVVLIQMAGTMPPRRPREWRGGEGEQKAIGNVRAPADQLLHVLFFAHDDALAGDREITRWPIKLPGGCQKGIGFTQAQVSFPYGQVSANGASVIKLLRHNAPADPLQFGGRGSETLMPERQKIVAIIEDDASMLRAAGDLLDAHGFATLAFASAEEFLARGAAQHVDCLLLDIDLGGMSGPVHSPPCILHRPPRPFPGAWQGFPVVLE